MLNDYLQFFYLFASGNVQIVGAFGQFPGVLNNTFLSAFAMPASAKCDPSCSPGLNVKRGLKPIISLGVILQILC